MHTRMDPLLDAPISYLLLRVSFFVSSYCSNKAAKPPPHRTASSKPQQHPPIHPTHENNKNYIVADDIKKQDVNKT